MIVPMQIDSLEELYQLQQLACKVNEPVYVHAADDSIMVDLIAMECHDEAHSKEFQAYLKKNGGE